MRPHCSTGDQRCGNSEPRLRLQENAFLVAIRAWRKRLWLRCEPILERPASALDRTHKWVQCKPAIASLVVARILLSLTVAIDSLSPLFVTFRSPPARVPTIYTASKVTPREGTRPTRGCRPGPVTRR